MGRAGGDGGQSGQITTELILILTQDEWTMAGHSNWANIAHKKGRIDAQKGKLFGKLSRAIIVAAQNGGGDPDMNLTLRYAIDRARKQSMPRDNIERAVKRGTGEAGGVHYENLVYEGYGPGGVAVICESLTDNRNRTASELRKAFEVYGGNMGATGCVGWMFQRKGVFVVPSGNVSEDALMEVALEAGADDLKRVGDSFEVTCPPDSFEAVNRSLEAAGYQLSSAEVGQVPQNTVDVTDVDVARRVLKLIEGLEENDDVQAVISNFNMPDEVLASLSAD